MKVSIDIDCTPEEARAFLGLPDIAPVQRAVMADLENRMKDALKAADPETILKNWLPLGAQGIEQLQKMFWGQMGGSAETNKGRKPGP